MRSLLLLALVCGIASAAIPQTPKVDSSAAEQSRAAALRNRIESTPRLLFQPEEIPIALPKGQKLGMVSWMASDPKSGDTWLLQRGTDLDPILAVNTHGQITHAFGKGAFQIPHAIRLDPDGHIWTVDAGSSEVIEWSPKGQRLLTLNLANPTPPSAFAGATDVAFAPDGQILVSDGYANARIVVYTAQGNKVRQWGSPGTGPSQFKLPHSIVVDEHGSVYVADRENGRIQRFDRDGHYLGQINNLGRTYALALGPDHALWASMSPMNQPPGSPGWLVKMDRTSGKLLGYLPLPSPGGLHGLAVNARAEPMTDLGNTVIRFRTPQSSQPPR